MRFRQVHLDFHTSEAIPGIGHQFSKKQFQQELQNGYVDSITLFSKCHHGWAYHPSKANEQHPHLTFNLLGDMIEAAHEIDVKTPVYLSAGLDERIARKHPEWLIRDQEDRPDWTENFLQPGYHQLCMNTPYLDVLLEQMKEVVTEYEVDGIFLDIVGVRSCYCQYCVRQLRSRGQDPRDAKAVLQLGEETYHHYCTKVRELIHGIKPGLGIFHNSSHITRGRRDLAKLNTHLELESLPTGGWGYDHFPLSARYAQGLGMDYLGMTGKFHASWGEFGGFKHPNALRYETALSLANGAKCSIGDQLHPEGRMDEATYALIGTAYREVATKEEWCREVSNVADVALLSYEAARSALDRRYEDNVLDRRADDGVLERRSDEGAVRILLEGHVLFDVIDLESEFNPYKVLILPDDVIITPDLCKKLTLYLNDGGKVLASGKSGLNINQTEFVFDFGVKWVEPNRFKPDYFRPSMALNNLWPSAYVMYSEGQRIELNGGIELGIRENPYFNRDLFTFCSHQHTPSSGINGGPGMAEGPDGIYIAWNVFEEYADKGSLILKEMVLFALDKLLSSQKTLSTNLPAQGVVTLQHQPNQNRYVNHLLYAAPVKRGKGIEVIEDVLPVHNVEVSLKLPGEAEPVGVYLAPQMTKLPFKKKGANISYTLPRLECHQMVVIDMVAH